MPACTLYYIREGLPFAHPERLGTIGIMLYGTASHWLEECTETLASRFGDGSFTLLVKQEDRVIVFGSLSTVGGKLAAPKTLGTTGASPQQSP